MELLSNPMHLIMLVLQGGTVFFFIWILFRYPVQPEAPINRVIAQALGLGQRQTVFESPVIGQILAYFTMLSARFPFLRARIRSDLEATGNPNGYTIDEYLAICLTSGVGLSLVINVFLWITSGELSFLFLLTMPVIGFYIPIISLHSQATKRLRVISKQLPYTLDLIALMMEAGGTFTEAINTLIQDDPYDDLNLELSLVQSEVDFGTQRAAALANMAERIPLDSLRSVVGAINQAEALGTPLSTILKNQSNMVRLGRSVKAEEASANASMRILIPGMLILVAVVIVVFAPIILSKLSGGMFS